MAFSGNSSHQLDPARVTFAVMSDLHCRLAKDPTDSSLEVGATRLPAVCHPVQSLIDLINFKQLQADALLVPGDLANRASPEGLSQGWDLAMEVGRALGTSIHLPVLGNHDIDSHRSRPDREPFYNARNLRPGFPFQDTHCVQSFFSEGFCVVDVGHDTQVVAVNTVIDHHDKESAKRGAFDDSRIYRLKEALSNTPSRPIRIAMMHHHPILHSFPFGVDLDVLSNGDALVSALRDGGCRFIVHGHKHLARLTIHNGVAIFAAGSFSATLGTYFSSMANMFHIVEVESTSGHIRGTIETYVFHYGSGWGRANQEHSGFPFSAGFGCKKTVPEIETLLRELASQRPDEQRFPVAQLAKTVEDLQYLTPADVQELIARIRQTDLRLVDSEEGYLELWRTST